MTRILNTVFFLAAITSGVINLPSCHTHYKPLEETLPKGPNFDVLIKNNSFRPRLIELAQGSSVTWLNTTPMPRQVAVDGFFSHTLESGDRFTYTFVKPGLYIVYLAPGDRHMSVRVYSLEHLP